MRRFEIQLIIINDQHVLKRDSPLASVMISNKLVKICTKNKTEGDMTVDSGHTKIVGHLRK